MSDELPQGWVMAALAQLTDNPKQDIISGPFGSNLKSDEYVSEGVPIIRLQNVDRNRLLEKNLRFITPQKARELSAHNFRAGDVVITKLGDPLGKACAIPESLQHGIVVADVVRVRIDASRFSRSYVLFAINSPTVANQINSEMMGSTRPRVNLNNIRDLNIPVAPLAEQRRIVAKLERLLGKVDASQQRLAKIPVLLKRFRQSVLAAACSGRLTADWREETETSETDWKRFRLTDLLAEPLSNGRSVPDSASGFPVLRLTCLKNGRIDLAERKIGAWTADSAKKFLVFKGDFFVSRGNGSLSHVGRGGLVEETPDGVAFPDTLIRVRLRKETIEPSFLRQVWSAKPIREQIESAAHTTAGIWKISQKDLEEFVLPVPPLPEQQEIVRRVEGLFALADQIELRLAKARGQVDKLTPSLLARAFAGKLVPQDPNDEPAAALLDRIKAHHEPKSRRDARK